MLAQGDNKANQGPTQNARQRATNPNPNLTLTEIGKKNETKKKARETNGWFVAAQQQCTAHGNLRDTHVHEPKAILRTSLAAAAVPPPPPPGP